MQNTPLVSVIVSAYNQERFIGRCLRSLLYQTLPQELYEIIIINDGSSDRTPYALELFNDGLNKSKMDQAQCTSVITNEKNIGLPASLNLGIRAARAPYIIRVDSDDYVNEDLLKFMYTYLDKNSDVDAVACDYLEVNDVEEVLRRCNCMEDPIACGILFQKNNLMDLGLYDEEFRCQEERELRIRFEKKHTIERLKIPLYRYRKHDNNMTLNHEAMEKHEGNLMRKHGLGDENKNS